MNINELVSIGGGQDFDHYGTLGFLLGFSLVRGLLKQTCGTLIRKIWKKKKVHFYSSQHFYLHFLKGCE